MPSRKPHMPRKTRVRKRTTGDAMPTARSRGLSVARPPQACVKIVEWSPDDGCFVGSAPPLIGRCCHGDDEQKVFAQLSQIVSEWLADHGAGPQGLHANLAAKRFSGKFQLRLGAELHRLLAFRAATSRKSINDVAVEAIERALIP